MEIANELKTEYLRNSLNLSFTNKLEMLDVDAQRIPNMEKTTNFGL